MFPWFITAVFIGFVAQDCSAQCTNIERCYRCTIEDRSEGCSSFDNIYSISEEECLAYMVESPTLLNVRYYSGSCYRHDCYGSTTYMSSRTFYNKTCRSDCLSQTITRRRDTMITASSPETYSNVNDEKYCLRHCMGRLGHCAYSYNFVTDVCLIFDGCTETGCTYDYHDTGCDDWWTGYRYCHPDCTPLGPIANGVITTAGAAATVMCDYGYETLTPILSCNTDGQWQYQSIVKTNVICNVIGCPTLSFTNGAATYPNGRLWNETAIFDCNTGYVLTGNTFAVCQGDKTWNASTPVCNIVNCQFPGTPVNGNTTFHATTFGQTAYYYCNTGYTRNGSSSTYCQASGNWTNPVPVCDIIDCHEPPVPNNGNVSYTTTTYSSTASFTCDAGYYVGSPMKSVCTLTGTWDVTSPLCILYDCNQLPDPANGTFMAPNGTTYGGIAYFSCNIGYYLTPSEVYVYCQADGTWNSTNIPSCTIHDCSAFSAVDNGITSVNGTQYGDVGNVTCNYGYELNSTDLVRCQADGTWKEPLPACLLVDCGIPQSIPDNGSMSLLEGTRFGANANFSCIQGLAPYPVSKRTCLVDKTWSSTNVTCEVPPPGGVFTTPTPRVIYVMPCLCMVNSSFPNMTSDEIIYQLVHDTAIDVHNTSLAVSALKCRSDPRQSSMFIGIFGVAFLAAVLGMIVLLDLLNVCRHCKESQAT